MKLTHENHKTQKQNGLADLMAALNQLIAKKMSKTLDVTSVEEMYEKRHLEIRQMSRAHGKFQWTPDFSSAKDIAIMKGIHAASPIYPIHSALCTILDTIGMSRALFQRANSQRLDRNDQIHWAALLKNNVATNLVRFQAEYMKIKTAMPFDKDVESIIEVLANNVGDLIQP